MPILLLCEDDGIEAFNYMMLDRPVETKSAINELRNALNILELPMRSCKEEINSLFQKFDLEEKISNFNKRGKVIKI